MMQKRFVSDAALLGAMVVLLFWGCVFIPRATTGKVSLILDAAGGANTILPTTSVASCLTSFSGPTAKTEVSATDSNPTIDLVAGT
jgi:hypothetical protein